MCCGCALHAPTVQTIQLASAPRPNVYSSFVTAGVWLAAPARRFSILNSLMVVVVMSSIVAMIMMRTIRRDLARYEGLLGESGAPPQLPVVAPTALLPAPPTLTPGTRCKCGACMLKTSRLLCVCAGKLCLLTTARTRSTGACAACAQPFSS